MATWIGHLRITENLLSVLPNLDETAFTFGNIAPDSGLPNADWTKFDPPKEVSHFLASPESGEFGVEDLRFHSSYLAGLSPDIERRTYSFLLGYYTHLLCDRLAMLKIGFPSTQIYQELFQDKPEVEAWDIIKGDWYALDQRYVRDHPNCLFWRIFLPSPIPVSPLPFVRQEAFEHQIQYIRKFYSQPSSEWVLDRPYPYLNENVMSLFVDQASDLVVRVLSLLETEPVLDGKKSGLELLPPEELLPYSIPLGDRV